MSEEKITLFLSELNRLSKEHGIYIELQHSACFGDEIVLIDENKIILGADLQYNEEFGYEYY